MPRTQVTYTGKEDPFVERNYGSALTFEPGQSRTLPTELAQKLLRHADVFALAEAAGATEAQEGKSDAGEGDASEQTDDTAAQLEASAKEQAEQADVIDQRQNVVDAVQLMDKEALKEYAQTNYRQPLPKTLSVENMRAKVIGMIDQYGLV